MHWVVSVGPARPLFASLLSSTRPWSSPSMRSSEREPPLRAPRDRRFHSARARAPEPRVWVDVLSFTNTSPILKEEADNYICGFLVPALLPDIDEGRLRGFMHYVDESKRLWFSQCPHPDVSDDVFCHIRDFTRGGAPVSNQEFAAPRTSGTVIEFSLGEQADGKVRAKDAHEVLWDGEAVRA